MANRSVWFKALLTPQSLIALVICLATIQYALPISKDIMRQAPKIELETSSGQAVSSREIELAVFDDKQLERPLFKTVSVAEDDAAIIRIIVESLQDEMSIWPASLTLDTVFLLGEAQTAVLDFSFERGSSQPSLNDEWRLLRSLSSSLKRNGYANLKILINHEESPGFLRYIRLDSVDD